eukprot:5128950-Prymnesium_polylepis.2
MHQPQSRRWGGEELSSGPSNMQSRHRAPWCAALSSSPRLSSSRPHLGQADDPGGGTQMLRP